ncbi:MAG: DsbA family protein [Patescibacteria group bacterium]
MEEFKNETQEVGAQEEKTAQESKKVKNLISAVVLLAGLLLGSVFVDVAQLFKGEGFSRKNLGRSNVFEADGKTWVAYQEPGVKVKVISDDNCAECNPGEALVWLRRVMPTVSAEKVAFDSEEGKALAEKFNLKSIPAFIFDGNVAKTDFYLQAQVLFEKKDDSFLFNVQELGIAPGKFLAMPEITEEDATLGNKEGLKLVVFSDFQCPYSKLFQKSLRENAKNFSDRVEFVFKHFPLNFHKQAENSALASECAREQGKFWEYADKLFEKQNEWGNTEGAAVFKNYLGGLGMNFNQFSQCLDSKKYQDKVNKDKEEAASFGISGTPAVFVGDQFKNGAMNSEQLKNIIEEELGK